MENHIQSYHWYIRMKKIYHFTVFMLYSRSYTEHWTLGDVRRRRGWRCCTVKDNEWWTLGSVCVRSAHLAAQLSLTSILFQFSFRLHTSDSLLPSPSSLSSVESSLSTADVITVFLTPHVHLWFQIESEPQNWSETAALIQTACKADTTGWRAALYSWTS